MHGNQQLPDSFAPHRNWIKDHLSESDAPKAWIFSDGKWTLQVSNHSGQRIEHLEYLLMSQTQIGILRFAALLNSESIYTVLYLYDGTMFSHSIFQPMNPSHKLDKRKSKNEDQWWIEPWSIDHLLS